MDAIADPLRRRASAVTDRLRRGESAGIVPADATPALHSLLRTTRAAAFWAGIALPFVHLPLLLVAGLSPETTPLLVALWALHALSLAVGAGHGPRHGGATRDATPATATRADGVPGDD